MNRPEFIAHVRESDSGIQSVERHLTEVGAISGKSAAAIRLSRCGRVLGLAHDLGKYSKEFQHYIRAGSGLLGRDARAEAEILAGKIDHATAGAQVIWESLPKTPIGRLVAQILSACVMSHHSRTGITDFVALDGSTPFLRRAVKHSDKTHLDQVQTQADPAILAELQSLLCSSDLIAEARAYIAAICQFERTEPLRHVHYALLTRFLFSCLLDADRTNTAGFEKPRSGRFRSLGRTPAWSNMTEKLEAHIGAFPVRNKIDELRRDISTQCLAAASRPRGVFTLTVPTGGGKTLASLRFALHHAALQSEKDAAHPIERIIYVIPYTSIIDQNARVARKIFGAKNILEHHSNLIPEKDTWRNRVLSENWDAPIVFTTSVQFLDSLFSAPTSAARRMHQLANAVIVFDEIQTLPVKTIHLFNNAVNFLVQACNTSVVFCTATQPLIGEVDTTRGAVRITRESEIVSDVRQLFKDLKRTQITDHRRSGGWSYAAAAELARAQLKCCGSVLFVANTKDAALKIYTHLKSTDGAQIYHLSTHMCPAHRKATLDAINLCLDPKDPTPVICVSTQLIEAGVDLDFGCAIRSLAGLDSIAQAGGRCNRNGRSDAGPVLIVNLVEEDLRWLPEIRQAQACTETVLDDFKSSPDKLDHDLLSTGAMRHFYAHYFFRRAHEMVYPLKAGEGFPPIAVDTSIFDLLSTNDAGSESYARSLKADEKPLPLRQALSTAAQAFRVIDAPTQGIVAPYGVKGRAIIGELAAAFTSEDVPLDKQIVLLRRAQQYTVNVFPGMLRKLTEVGAVREVQPESGIYYLDDRYYHDELGVTHEALSELPLNQV
jgi:CRISPR-associated endonuclease/helicase Cas3